MTLPPVLGSSHILPAAIAGLGAALLTALLTPLMRVIAIKAGWVSKPIQDRWGRRVIPRLGGAAMALGFLIPALVVVPLERRIVGLLWGAALAFLLGLADDLHRLRPYTKLLGQMLIGCVVVMHGVRIDLIPWRWVAVPMSVLWLVLVMNAFNLLDNMDGLCAGTGALAAAFCAFYAALSQNWAVMLTATILCGVCLGFLRFNFYPAKIYMGDSGSHLLGLSLAALALMGTWSNSTQLLSVLAVPVLLLAVPLFDTLFVTIQRLVHGRHPFVGGADHVSHRLAILGLSVPQTVLLLYGASACLGLLSVLSLVIQPFSVLVIVLLAVSLFVVVGGYLARVKVYRFEASADAAPESPPGKPVTRIETMLWHKRRLVEVLVDFALISSAYVCAHLLRYEGALNPARQELLVRSLPVILAVKLACFAGFGMYRGVWRYFGAADILVLFKATALGSILSSMTLLFLWRFEGYSRAVLIIDWMLLFLAVGGVRVVERFLDEWIKDRATQARPCLIMGAGDTGARVLESLRYDAGTRYRVIGFLDDDWRKWGSRIQGCPVFGSREELAPLLDRYQVRDVLIAMADPPGQLLEHVKQCCEPRAAAWKVVSAGLTAI